MQNGGPSQGPGPEVRAYGLRSRPTASPAAFPPLPSRSAPGPAARSRGPSGPAAARSRGPVRPAARSRGPVPGLWPRASGPWPRQEPQRPVGSVTGQTANSWPSPAFGPWPLAPGPWLRPSALPIGLRPSWPSAFLAFGLPGLRPTGAMALPSRPSARACSRGPGASPRPEPADPDPARRLRRHVRLPWSVRLAPELSTERKDRPQRTGQSIRLSGWQKLEEQPAGRTEIPPVKRYANDGDRGDGVAEKAPSRVCGRGAAA